jgi:hypothetical protein
MFYLKAFFDLTTCRDAGWGAGPIPWTAIHLYGTDRGLEGHLLDHFSHVIRIVDREYLKYIEEQRPKTKSPKKSGGRQTTRQFAKR